VCDEASEGAVSFFTFGLFEIVNADLYPSHLLPRSFLLESGHFLFHGSLNTSIDLI
jgi:hypothetical protein